MGRTTAASISKDQMAHFDPAVEKITVKDGFINMKVAYNTSVVTISEQELHWMTKLLQETNSGI